MARSWYVLHTLSGHELKVERSLRLLMAEPDMAELIVDVKVPSEEVVEIRDGKKRISKKRFLPGYVLVQIDMPEREWRDVTNRIRRLQGITGFVGNAPSSRPQPISPEEAKSILQKAGEIKGEKTARPKQSFEVGDQVRIVDGPFASFTGAVDEVHQERGKLRVMVGIFGRSTPVEVDFLQVEKV